VEEGGRGEQTEPLGHPTHPLTSSSQSSTHTHTHTHTRTKCEYFGFVCVCFFVLLDSMSLKLCVLMKYANR